LHNQHLEIIITTCSPNNVFESSGDLNHHEIPTDKGEDTDICKQVLSVESNSAQDLSGKLVAALSAILPAPISSTTANPSPQSITLIPGSASMVDTQSPQMEQKGHSNDSTIQSSASLQGWGAVYNGTRTGGY